MKPVLLTFLFSLLTQPLLAVDTVADLDLNKYLGPWHQIGAIPQQFAKDCAQNTMAEYNLLPDGLIQVLNSCENAEQEVVVVEGRARVTEEFNDPARLEVTFVKALGGWFWTFAGDYWVVDLDPNYQWSLVGHPKLNGLYILSRSPEIDLSILKSLEAKMISIGYDSCDVVMSKTPANQFQGTERLCDLKL